MIDIIITGILLISVLIGWFRGAVKEVCSVISWFGSGYLAYKLFPVGLEIVQEFIEQPILANIITGVLLFVIFLIILSLLTYIFSKIVNESIFSTVDKLCGSLFGLVRGILILSVAEFGATYYIFKETPEVIKQSTLFPYIKNVAQMMFLLLPEKTQRNLMSYSSKDKQQELIRALGGKLKDTIIASQDSTNSINTNTQSPAQMHSTNNARNSESSQHGISPSQNNGTTSSRDTTSSSGTTSSMTPALNTETGSNDKLKATNELTASMTNNTESKIAKELARLGIRKPEVNPNISKSVRSDLDRFIDQTLG